MNIWRRRAGKHWLHLRNEEITAHCGSSLAVIERPGGKRALLEIYCKTERQARELVRDFGGSVEPLGRDWLQHFWETGAAQTVAHRRALARSRRARAKQNSSALDDHSGRSGVWNGWTCYDRDVFAVARPRYAPSPARMDDARCRNGQRHSRDCGKLFRRGASARNRQRSPRLRHGEAQRARESCSQYRLRHWRCSKTKLRGKFDIITANLFSEILINALPVWSRYLAPNGSLILSGILRSQERAICRALKKIIH